MLLYLFLFYHLQLFFSKLVSQYKKTLTFTLITPIDIPKTARNDAIARRQITIKATTHFK